MWQEVKVAGRTTLHCVPTLPLLFVKVRLIFLAYQTDISGVLTVIEKSVFTRGTTFFGTRDKYLL